MTTNSGSNEGKQVLQLKLDYRWISLALLVAVVAMLLIWKPWQSSKTSDRTVEVTGQATLSAVPDEFIFYPTYEFKNSDKQAALDELTSKSDELIAGLKALGVASSKIKTNSDGWAYPIYYGDTSGETTYSLRLTVTLNKLELAQKVQDYLVSTTPSGSVSPQANFSETKRKELEDKARDEATKNARSKAEQSAKNLGFKLAAVKKVDDAAGFGGFYPLSGVDAAVAEDKAMSLAVQPGENELSYSVTVTYFIK